MASIDIFPIAIGGVYPPLNLLSDIFSPSLTGSRSLSYPLDLGTNPTFAHAIQFSVYDYEYTGLSEATKALHDYVVQNYGELKSNAGNVNKIKENLATIGGGIQKGLPIGQGENFKPVTIGAPLSIMSLYMPDTVNTTYDSNYNAVQMYDVLGVSNLIANVFSDKKAGNIDFKNPQSIVNAIGSQNLKEVGSVLAGLVGGGMKMQSGDLTGALRQVFKQVPNPQMQLTYKGINLREFQFEFIFTPISAKEAQVVDNIINRFVYYSVPGLMGTVGEGQYLQPPQIFKINFAYTGGNSATKALTNVFQNTLTNVFGTQIANDIGFNGLNKSSPNANSMNGAKLFTIGDCVLTNVNVDYAPNGWAAYDDGYPVQTRLTLQFKEMDLVTKDKVNPARWAKDSASSPANGSLSSQIDTMRSVAEDPHSWS